jgi:apolipoprotein N-acyltransferase
MICFEDVFPNLVRKFVRNGAHLLINLTNDAWFDGTAASVQHLSHSVLRAVENRVPVVRAANTGVSCFIDRSGRIYARIVDGPDGRPAEATLLSGVEFPPLGQPLTLYTRWGDWMLALPCGLAVAAGTLLALIMWRRKGKTSPLEITPGGKNPDAFTAPVARPPDSGMETQDD